MAVSSVSTSSYTQLNKIQQSAPEVRGERENDGDRDDGAAAKVAAAAPKPTVNTMGEAIGTTISVTA